MKILQLPSWYLPEGGQFCQHQSIALLEAGIEVSILANVILPLRKYKFSIFTFPLKAFYTKEDGISIFRYYAWKIPFFEFLNMKKWVHKTVSMCEQHIAKNGKPDLIHAHSSMWAGYAAALIKRKYGIPYIITEHRGRFSENSKDTEKLFKPFYTKYLVKSFSNANAIILVSNQLKRRINGFCTREVPFYTISNILDTSLFRLKKGSLLKFPFVFMNANSFDPAKGYDILLPAFDKVCEKHPSATLYLLGENFDNDEFLGIIENIKHKKNIILTGLQNSNGVLKFMHKSHAFVLSSRIESQSISVLEALSCGIPIVCTKAVPEEITPPFAAIRCDSNSVEELYVAMVEMIDNYDSFDSLAISNFANSICSKEKVVSELLKVYTSIVKT